MKRILAVWLAVALTAIVVEAAVNVPPYAYKQRARDNPADSTWIESGVIHFEQMDSAIAVTIRVSDKVITDTVYGSGGDITRVLGTMFADSARVGNRLRFGFDGYTIYLDSARVDSMVQQLGRFAPGGAGTGDIEGVTADSGLTGGGITGTVSLKVLVGWGLLLDNDSVKVDMQALLDSISVAADSNAQTYSADRYQSYTGTGAFLIGNDGDSTFIVIDSVGNFAIVWASWYVGVEDPDSITMLTKHWIQSLVHDTLDANGFLTGLNSTNGITGGASMGIVTVQLDGSAFYVDNDTVRIFNNNTGRLILNVFGTPTDINEIVVAENQIIFGSGVDISGLTNTQLYVADIFRETTSADSAYSTWGRIIAAIKNGAEIYNKIDTTNAKIPTASVADSAVRGDTAVTLQWAEGRVIAHDTMWANSPGYLTSETGDISSVALGNGGSGDGTSGAVTLNVVAGTSTGLAVNADSVYVTTIPDAYIATTLCRDTEASSLAHDSLWANTPGFATKANVHDSLFANTPGYITGNQSITLSGDVSGTGTTAIITAIGSAKITTAMVQGSAIDSTKIAPASVLLSEMASNSVDSTKIVDGGIGSGDIGTGRITTTHVLDNTLAAADIATGGVATAEILDNTVAPADIDSTGSVVIGNARTRAASTAVIKSNNFQATDPDSSLKLGSGAGLIVSSEILYGTDITDDSLVDLYIPEDLAMCIARGWSTVDIAYNDSMVIRGNSVPDSLEGNALRFNDSTLTSGNHRRHVHLEVDVPPDCDSLRRVIIRCKSGTYSAGTTELFTVARLARRPFTWSLVDSAIGGSMLDKDSSAAASATDITLSANWAVTRHTSLYLLLSGRRDVGTVYNYADVYEVRFIWHRTGL